MPQGYEGRGLMLVARDPEDPATQAFGGVLARFRIQGLDAAAMQRLLGRYFPGAARSQSGAAELPPAGAACTALSEEEFADLLALLREHRRDDSEETDWVAHAIASACAGENHLWEDMGLPSRAVLSQLIRHYFTTLYYKNAADLKWKKFFYKQLCDRAEVRVCKAPSCGVCSDYVNCFGQD